MPSVHADFYTRKLASRNVRAETNRLDRGRFPVTKLTDGSGTVSRDAALDAQAAAVPTRLREVIANKFAHLL